MTATTRWYRLPVLTVITFIATGAQAQQPATMPKQILAESAPKASVQQPAAATSKASMAWRGRVIAHLNSYMRGFSAVAGTPTVAFTFDRTGKILSTRIAGSGSAAVDKQALALVQRASPLPAPPSDLAGAKFTMALAILFRP